MNDRPTTYDDDWERPDPAPTSAPDGGAGEVGTVNIYPGIDRQGYDILSGGKLDRWKADRGDAFEYGLVLANDNIRSLIIERDTLRSQLADTQAENARLRAAVQPFAIEEMSSTLLPDNHEVKGLGCFIEHEGQKLLFFESSVVSDLQHELSLAKDRIAVLEQSEQMLLKRIKKLKNKSELDDGFIDHLTSKGNDNE